MANESKSATGRVGAVLLIRKNGSLLMQLRDNKEDLRHSGKWVPPGGHAEQSEDMITCARREFLEETSYDCVDLKFITEFEDRVEGWPSYELTLFWDYYDETQEIRCLEGQDVKFIRREEANLYDIPKYLLNLWDITLKIANIKKE